MQRKKTKNTRLANSDEKEFMDWIKNQRCVICGASQVIAHHCEGAATKIKVDFMTVLIGHWFLLPLCQDHDDIITLGSRRAFREQFGPQSVLCLRLLEKYPDIVPEVVIEGIRLWSK